MTEIEKLKAKHAKELAELETELAIRAALPDLGMSWKVHVGELYGTVASVTIEHDFYQYGDKKPQPTLETVRAAGLALPGVPLVMVRDGCLSFRPQSNVETMPEAKKERWTEELQVCPFIIKLSAFQQHTAEFDWAANVGGFLVRVRVKLPAPPELARLEVAYCDYFGGRRVKDCRVCIGDKAHVIYRDGNSLAGLESPIRFASGSPQTPNDFTLYYVNYGDETATVADLVDTLSRRGSHV